MNLKYILITPVRNEEFYIENTILSVINQKIKPVEWVIVNDGSTDKTEAIIQLYEKKYDWIQLVNRSDRGFRKSGTGVMEAFYDGFKHLTTQDWDFLVKLDGDLSFDEDYFLESFKKFSVNPSLGIGGGMVNSVVKNEIIHEGLNDPIFHVRGATKIYRRKCWDDIEGLYKTTGWDTLDELKANMLGWETYSFRDLKVIQHKVTGIADGTWKNYVKNGRANYLTGYHPIFMLFKILKRLQQKPYGIISFALMTGYFSSYFNGTKPIADKQLLKYIRKQQINRLLFKDTIWKY
jgi:glycosyltransferase involved in cell wall biosynthesis